MSRHTPEITTFAELNLAPAIQRAVDEKGYKVPTEIQLEAIPIIAEGRDLLGTAQTGTGKTAAFALPILHQMRLTPPGLLRCLVLTPTRELAIQIAENFRAYGKYLHFHVGTAIGGVDMRNQLANIRHGADIIVATPGRLKDHMYNGNLDFGNLEYAVIDEADRMFDMGFIDDVRFIVSCLPKKRQTLLFSATLDREVLGLAGAMLDDPVSVTVTPSNSMTAEGISHVAFYVKSDSKKNVIRHIIDEERMDHAIIFTRTKIGADKLAKFLEHGGLRVGVLHSDRTQQARFAVLEQFKKHKIRLLVATDVASRGLDISGVSHVVNFDIPQTSDAYVHRVGRTARAGEQGDAITLVSPEDRKYLRSIEEKIGEELPWDVIPGLTMAPPSGGSGAPRAPRTDRGDSSRGHGRKDRPSRSGRAKQGEARDRDEVSTPPRRSRGTREDSPGRDLDAPRVASRGRTDEGSHGSGSDRPRSGSGRFRTNLPGDKEVGKATVRDAARKDAARKREVTKSGARKTETSSSARPDRERPPREGRRRKSGAVRESEIDRNQETGLDSRQKSLQESPRSRGRGIDKKIGRPEGGRDRNQDPPRRKKQDAVPERDGERARVGSRESNRSQSDGQDRNPDQERGDTRVAARNRGRNDPRDDVQDHGRGDPRDEIRDRGRSGPRDEVLDRGRGRAPGFQQDSDRGRGPDQEANGARGGYRSRDEGRPRGGRDPDRPTPVQIGRTKGRL